MRTDERETDADAAEARTRLVVYALASPQAAVDEAVVIALHALRAHADRLVVVASRPVAPAARHDLVDVADLVMEGPGDVFAPRFYSDALEQDAGDWDEVLLTGDSWFGPITALGPVFERMASSTAAFWRMVAEGADELAAFPDEGFPRRSWPWSWMLVRRAVLEDDAWAEYARTWAQDMVDETEGSFAARLAQGGFDGDVAFDGHRFGNGHPAVLSPAALIEAGCPLVSRVPFTLYPPFLQQHGIVGREVLALVRRHGYPLSAVWPALARAVPPKALNTNAGMLEVLPQSGPQRAVELKLAVVAYISDVDAAIDLRDRLRSLPPGYDLIITTNDGVKARRLQKIWESTTPAFRTLDIRVTPAGPGAHMSGFFVACRDVLLRGDYDLIMKVHARRKRGKTVNLRRYFHEYQWDNLLESPEYVRALLALFDEEPGLGIAFPPMIHIGYSTMGRGWGAHRASAAAVLAELGVAVPQDRVSPLAPYGGMWIARPAALRPLAERGWRYSDYRRTQGGDLARIQERIAVSVAAAQGFHARTVLTRRHAAISHTAIEFKADEMMSTTTGYPVDQIALVHRAGYAGRGGIVGLTRMYVRLNHPVLSKLVLPLMALAEKPFLAAIRVRDGIRRARPQIGTRFARRGGN